MSRPIETPWGPSQHHSDYAVGIVFHSTASHGGFHLSLERQAELHEVEAFRAFGPGWLEEDCEAALVALRWPGFATDEAISDAIATARQVASWDHSEAKWQPVVDWLETTSLQERADRHHEAIKHLWERGSMSTTGKGGKWLVSFRRGATERRTVTMDYPEKRYYSDEELSRFEFTDFSASVGGFPLHGKIADDESIWMLANNGTSPNENKREQLQSEFDRIRSGLIAGQTVTTKTATITPER